MNQQELVNTKPIEQLVDRIGANTVFGEPRVEKDVVIIPVAQVEFGFGYGGGYGRGGEDEEEEGEGHEGESDDNGSAEGAGGGGGAGGRATPRGYIRISADEVKYEPIMDHSRIPLAGILMVAWIVFWVMFTVRTIATVVAKTKQAKRQG